VAQAFLPLVPVVRGGCGARGDDRHATIVRGARDAHIYDRYPFRFTRNRRTVMDLITAVSTIPGIGPAMPYIASAVVLAAVIAPALPPPAAPGIYAAVYRLINLLAVNVGHARNAGDPFNDEEKK
jgi:hypothetical protein